MNSLHKLKNNRTNQNGKILLKLFQQTRNLFHLKIRNHKKSTIYIKITIKIKQFFLNKKTINKKKTNKCNKKIISKRLKKLLMLRMKSKI